MFQRTSHTMVVIVEVLNNRNLACIIIHRSHNAVIGNIGQTMVETITECEGSREIRIIGVTSVERVITEEIRIIRQIQ